MGWLTKFWTQVSLVFLILISIILLVLNNRAEQNMPFENIRQIADDITSPAMQAIDLPLSGFQKMGNWLISYWNATSRVRLLEQENRNLRQWEALSHALHAKILRYEKLLNLQGEVEVRVVSSRMIAEARGPFVRSGLLPVGRTKGVANGQAVVDPQGMIGRIVTVGKNSSRVLLLNDLNSRIPVIFAGSSMRAILAGDNTRYPKLIFMGGDFIATPGTRISTSGDDGVLPAGLAIGEVLAGDGDASRKEFRVRIYANLTAIDYVQVLARQPVLSPEQEIEAAETTSPVVAVEVEQ